MIQTYCCPLAERERTVYTLCIKILLSLRSILLLSEWWSFTTVFQIWTSLSAKKVYPIPSSAFTLKLSGVYSRCLPYTVGTGNVYTLPSDFPHTARVWSKRIAQENRGCSPLCIFLLLTTVKNRNFHLCLAFLQINSIIPPDLLECVSYILVIAGKPSRRTTYDAKWKCSPFGPRIRILQPILMPAIYSDIQKGCYLPYHNFRACSSKQSNMHWILWPLCFVLLALDYKAVAT